MNERVLPKPQPIEEPPPVLPLLVLTNVPDEALADSMARALVDERLAACVNILAPCRSVYRWQGAVEEATEIPLLIKSTTDRYDKLQARIRELHPYDTPEILRWQPDGGWPPYLSWMIAQTRRPRGRRGAQPPAAAGGQPSDPAT